MLFENLPLSDKQLTNNNSNVQKNKKSLATCTPVNAWLTETIQRCVTRVEQLSRKASSEKVIDSRPSTAKTLFTQLSQQLNPERIAQLELTAYDLLEVYQAVTDFFPKDSLDNKTKVIADQFPQPDVINLFSNVYPSLEEKILQIPTDKLEDLVDICIRINHCFNIISEVERLSRTKGTGSLENIYNIAKQSGFSVSDIDKLIIIWTGTAHPNRFVTLPIEKTIGELVDILVKDSSADSQEISQLFCTMLNANIIPQQAPKRTAEASYIARTFEEAGVKGLKTLFRQDYQARRQVWGDDCPAPAYVVNFHLWPTFDWDGQRNPNYAETIDSIKRNRQLACDVLTKQLNAIIATAPEHIEFNFDNGTVSVKELLARFLNRIRATQAGRESHDPISQSRLINGLSCMIDAVKSSSDAKTYSLLIDDLEELRFIARNIGLHLATGEHRQNSLYNENVLDQISNILGIKNYSSKSEQEKIDFLAKFLQSDSKIKSSQVDILNNLESLPKDAKEYFQVLLSIKEELLEDPQCCSRTIISLTTSTSDILEVELLLKLAGINESDNSAKLEIVPLFERPEDKIICDSIFKNALDASESLLSLAKYFGRLSAMAGYSDGQMRGGPGDRELSREVEERISSVAKNLNLKWAIEHGLGPGVGRGGGFNGDQSMLTSDAVESKYIHFTIQGTAIGKLLRVSTSACRQAITAIRNYVEGLCRINNYSAKDKVQQDEYRNIRKQVFANARDQYSDLIGRGKIYDFCGKQVPGEDVFFASLNLVFPPEYLDGLKQVSRPLFRFDQKEGQTFFNGLQDNPEIWVSYEDFRAVPNSQISDGTRLCYLSLYSWGSILQDIRTLKGDQYLQQMYVNDRAFQADVNGALLALQVANIPYALTLYRTQYNQYKDKPLVKELFKNFDKIEADYKLLLDAIEVLEPVITDRVRSTINEIRKIRSLKDPTTYVLQTIRAAVTSASHKNPQIAKEYSTLTKLISVAMGTSLDTGS